MSRQQLLLRQDLTISEILQTYEKQFRQIQSQYSDGNDGRCAIGVVMSYFGWDGGGNFETVNSLLAAADTLKQAGIDEELLIDLNDSGFTFDEIADYVNELEK
ncbi:MAG TPA: hypothetical protein VE548_02525 [Nitrososphaeraceae archaeon]|jgi:hypothetical protein|nr:hypothetical protein [Nitrososphaeraceae archaeon]